LANKFGASEKLTGGALVAIDEAYVRESILRPQAKVVDGYQPLMPTFQGLVSEENVMALVEYVKSLRANTAVSRAEAPEEPASPTAPQENR
jgi:cytochrome c oxidase subunit 2